MKRTTHNPFALPRYDYARALQNAVSWLGPRYVLAEPVIRRPDPSRPYFGETPRWYGARRPDKG